MNGDWSSTRGASTRRADDKQVDPQWEVYRIPILANNGYSSGWQPEKMGLRKLGLLQLATTLSHQLAVISVIRENIRYLESKARVWQLH